MDMETLKLALVAIGMPVLRSVGGWANKALKDNKVTDYEWRMYEVTAVGSLTGAVEVAGEEVATQDNQAYTHTYVSQAFALQILSGPYVEEVVYYTLVAADLDVVIDLTVDDND